MKKNTKYYAAHPEELKALLAKGPVEISRLTVMGIQEHLAVAFQKLTALQNDETAVHGRDSAWERQRQSDMASAQEGVMAALATLPAEGASPEESPA
jgi:hypothetical protein